jgi:hypothetical protein
MERSAVWKKKKQRGLLSAVNGTWREKQLETIQEY